MRNQALSPRQGSHLQQLQYFRASHFKIPRRVEIADSRKIPHLPQASYSASVQSCRFGKIDSQKTLTPVAGAEGMHAICTKTAMTVTREPRNSQPR